MATIFTGADIILGASTIRQVTQVDHKTGHEHRKATNSGAATVVQVSGKSQISVTSFTSADLATLLALNTNTFISAGFSVASGTVTVPFKARADRGLFASGSSHPAIGGANVLCVPTSLEASQDADFATMQCDIHWLSTDGLTNAAVSSTGNALGAQAFSAEFALGPCYINGSLLAGVQSFRVTPGIEVVKPPLGSGATHPTLASIKMVEPTVEITVNDFATVAATVGAFTAMTSANLYLRKRLDSGVYSSSTDNCRITFAAGLTDTGTVSVSNNDDGSATITLHGKTLTASAAVAIP